MIEAVQTAPYHSRKNPCERVNCILNLGLQAVGLMRSTMAEKYKYAISSCSSVQKQFEESPGLKEALQDCMKPVKVLAHSLFSRLKLKDKPMLSFASASDHEVEKFANILCDIEPDLEALHAAKNDLKKLPKLKEFLSHCCYECKYVFGVKKSMGRIDAKFVKLLNYIKKCLMSLSISQTQCQLMTTSITSHSLVSMEHSQQRSIAHH